MPLAARGNIYKGGGAGQQPKRKKAKEKRKKKEKTMASISLPKGLFSLFRCSFTSSSSSSDSPSYPCLSYKAAPSFYKTRKSKDYSAGALDIKKGASANQDAAPLSSRIHGLRRRNEIFLSPKTM